jgi:hypothetical protein
MQFPLDFSSYFVKASSEAFHPASSDPDSIKKLVWPKDQQADDADQEQLKKANVKHGRSGFLFLRIGVRIRAAFLGRIVRAVIFFDAFFKAFDSATEIAPDIFQTRRTK